MWLLVFLVLFLLVFFLSGGTIDMLLTGPGGEILFLTVVLVLLLSLGVYVAAALGASALLLAAFFSDQPLFGLFGAISWGLTQNFVFVAAPLFILMGHILLRSGATERLFSGLSSWVSGVPGGLLHTNVVASAVFGSVSGSSMATAATIGSMALPYFRHGKYNSKLVFGSLAAGGTLGILIPPSLGMIWYSLLTENSIGQLFLAGVVPGLILVGLFMVTIMIFAVLRPEMAPRETGITWGTRLRALGDILPTVVLVAVVLGSIYAGIATPTEAAALGVVASLGMAAFYRRLTWKVVRESIEGTARVTAMVALILIFADVFSFVVGAMGIPQTIASTIAGLELNPYLILLVIIAFYVVAGTFLDDIALTFATLPVIYPLIEALALQFPEILIFNGIAFGILFVVLMQMAIISPPDGITLYVIQGLREEGGSMADVFLGVTPFILSMIVLIALLILYPQIALWLPNLVFGGG
jgi:tripartite ATP-independent transporter DctM subunit